MTWAGWSNAGCGMPRWPRHGPPAGPLLNHMLRAGRGLLLWRINMLHRTRTWSIAAVSTSLGGLLSAGGELAADTRRVLCTRQWPLSGFWTSGSMDLLV